MVDASGSIDIDGKIGNPSCGNPVQDAIDVELEVERLIADILINNKESLNCLKTSDLAEGITTTLSGIKAKLFQAYQALETSKCKTKKIFKVEPRRNYSIC